ncbi:MAG TPA: STAS domain-containing protein [Labilithrix sp.]|jgi:anti-anti-sigma regulatory factor|nr:STAS domain-containing protein [Labilithrix sp.]
MIRTLLEPPVLTVDVDGPASMVEGAAVQELAREHVAAGARSLRIDLRACTAMDSTFSGTLLSLERLLAPLGGTLTLVSPSPKVVEVLRQMGLEDFYAIDVAERAVGAWRDVIAAHPAVDTLRRVVLDSHDELARIPGPASDTFREVARELHRTEPDRPSVPH